MIKRRNQNGFTPKLASNIMNSRTIKKVLVIGFEPYNEMMYPHTYDFLKIIEKHCDLIYFGDDDRGVMRYTLGNMKPESFHPRTLARFLYQIVNHIIHRTRNKIKKLMNEDVDIVIAIDHSALHFEKKFRIYMF